jgi:hypothetical protein
MTRPYGNAVVRDDRKGEGVETGGSTFVQRLSSPISPPK